MRVSQALTDVDFGLILAKNTERTPPEFPFSLQKIKARELPVYEGKKK